MRTKSFALSLFLAVTLIATVFCFIGAGNIPNPFSKIMGAAVGAYWGADEVGGIKYWTQLLTLRNSTNTRDSTAVHPSHRYMTVSILPGKTTSTPDSFHSNKDSTQIDVFVRFWNDRSRNNISSVIKLVDAMSCQSVKYTTTSTNADSMNFPVNFTNVAATTITAGTGTWDSTRIDLTDIRNNLRIKALAPYFDVVIFDADTKVGKAAKYIVQVNYADY